MIDPTPKVDYSRGAPMGRYTGPHPEGNGDKWRLQRVPIDAGGYDRGGAYWGLGAPLYWACNTSTGAEMFFRLEPLDYRTAHAEAGGKYLENRDVARHVVRRDCDPLAKFYR